MHTIAPSYTCHRYAVSLGIVLNLLIQYLLAAFLCLCLLLLLFFIIRCSLCTHFKGKSCSAKEYCHLKHRYPSPFIIIELELRRVRAAGGPATIMLPEPDSRKIPGIFSRVADLYAHVMSSPSGKLAMVACALVLTQAMFASMCVSRALAFYLSLSLSLCLCV